MLSIWKETTFSLISFLNMLKGFQDYLQIQDIYVGFPALPSWPPSPKGQVVHVPSICLHQGICHHGCLDWGLMHQLWMWHKGVHQSRASCALWVNLSGLKRSNGDLYVCLNQNWKWHEWSLARSRAMLEKLVRLSSLITPLHTGDKATLAAPVFIACTFSPNN